jgi:2-iminoacetate synthase ThiH
MDDDEVKESKKRKSMDKSNENDHSDEAQEIKDMKEYMNRASWDTLVQEIDTVERDEEVEELIVYFRLCVLYLARICTLRCRSPHTVDQEGWLS